MMEVIEILLREINNQILIKKDAKKNLIKYPKMNKEYSDEFNFQIRSADELIKKITAAITILTNCKIKGK